MDSPNSDPEEDNIVMDVARRDSTSSDETFHSNPVAGENVFDEEFSGTSSESEMVPEYDLDAEVTDFTNYDPEVTPYHLYMGNMDCVPGMRVYDPKSIVRLFYCFHNSIVYPGEIIPMIFSAEPAAADEFGAEPIALVFAERTTLKGFGVTGQVVEMSVSSDQKIRAKVRVLQRFKVVSPLPLYPYSIVLLPHYVTESSSCYTNVEILPEFQLGPPVSSRENLSVNRWTNTEKSMADKIRRFKSIGHAWPDFVYTMYDVGRIMMKIQYFSVELGNDNMPKNPIQCSFWSARNLPISDEDQAAIFKSDFLESRMLLIEKNLNSPYKYCCLHCDHAIANFRDVFPMTKDGVQASYCNKNGFIHETVTVSSIEADSMVIEDHSSTRFSWFPGYSWRIAYCNICSRHKGWKFTAVRKGLKPDFFYGLSRNSVILRKLE